MSSVREACMKLLIEYDISTGTLIGAAPDGVAFVDLPETSGSCLVEDEELSEQIWQSHSNGGAVTLTIVDGLVTDADIETVEPPAPLPTLEEANAMLAFELAETQFRLAQAEQAQADLIFNLVERGAL
jgi:hypothetical protein